MATRMKNSAEICQRIHDLATALQSARPTKSQKDYLIKALGEIDGKLPSGDAKLEVIKALGAAQGTAGFMKTAVVRHLRAAITAIDQTWIPPKPAPKPRVRARTSTNPLTAAYQRAASAANTKNIETQVAAEYPLIEQTLIEVLNKGIFNVSFAVSSILLPQSPLGTTYYLSLLNKRWPPGVPATATAEDDGSGTMVLRIFIES